MLCHLSLSHTHTHLGRARSFDIGACLPDRRCASRANFPTVYPPASARMRCKWCICERYKVTTCACTHVVHIQSTMHHSASLTTATTSTSHTTASLSPASCPQPHHIPHSPPLPLPPAPSTRLPSPPKSNLEHVVDHDFAPSIFQRSTIPPLEGFGRNRSHR